MSGASGAVLSLGFLQPWLLAWLVTAAIPVVIHLWSRHRCRQIAWAAMEFLLAALRAQRRRLLLEQWLLLLLRMLIFVLLALAIAQPFIGSGALPGAALQPVHGIVLIDASRSMQARRNGATAFEKAKDAAGSLIRKAHPKDTLSLGVFTSTVRWIIREPVASSVDLSAQLAELSPTDAAADIPAMIADVTALIGELSHRDPRPIVRQVWILTDLQASNWWPRDTQLQLRLREEMASLLQLASVQIVDVGPSDRTNIGLEFVGVQPAPLLAGDTAEMAVRLASFALSAPRSVQVAVQVNEETLAKQTVTVIPGSDSVIRLSHRFFGEGDQLLEVRLVDNADALPVDDRLQIVLPVHRGLRVLCVDGRAGGDLLGGPAGYLMMALNPGGTVPLQGSIFVDKRPANVLAELDPTFADAILLCDVPEISPAEAELLARFVRQGGGLVIFLGDLVRPKAYNALLPASEENCPSLLPVRLLRPVEDDPQFRLDPLGYRHPLLHVFREHERAGLVNIPVEKYWAVDVLPGQGATVALALGNGRPFIVEKTLGLGRVIVVASPPDPGWTLLPKWPSFVPLVHEMVRFAVQGKFPLRNVLLGECFEAFFPPDQAGSICRVLTPAGEEESVGIREDAGWASVRFCPTENAGLYRLGPSEGNELFYAALPPAAESDLQAISPEDLSRLWGNLQGLHIAHADQLPRDMPAVTSAGAYDLSHHLLWALCLLLAFESILAYRLTRGGL